jgi:hypothetical protein
MAWRSVDAGTGKGLVGRALPSLAHQSLPAQPGRLHHAQNNQAIEQRVCGSLLDLAAKVCGISRLVAAGLGPHLII